MAECIVEIIEVEKVEEHPNADNLEIVFVKGWQCVVRKGEWHVGDEGLYIPIDAIIPPRFAETIGVSKYLSNGRTVPVRLRGVPSYGIFVSASYVPKKFRNEPSLANALGITKYIPLEKVRSEDIETPHPLFSRYTDIENLRNYPEAFEAGELVSVTEKVHGANCRVGLIESEWMAGSMNQRRRKPADISSSLYWKPLNDPNLVSLIVSIGGPLVITYGEIYGNGVQSLDYDLRTQEFSVFDIFVNGKFLDVDKLYSLCEKYSVRTVPVLYEGPFDMDLIISLSEGKSSIASHIREGVVVRSIRESTSACTGGRRIFKRVGDTYLTSKHKSRENS
jgi:RNA ligase (TIGR02306 family)